MIIKPIALFACALALGMLATPLSAYAHVVKPAKICVANNALYIARFEVRYIDQEGASNKASSGSFSRGTQRCVQIFTNKPFEIEIDAEVFISTWRTACKYKDIQAEGFHEFTAEGSTLARSCRRNN